MTDIAIITALATAPRFLRHFKHTYKSVTRQTDADWEWRITFDVNDTTMQAHGRSGVSVGVIAKHVWSTTGVDLLGDPRIHLDTSSGGVSAARHRGIITADAPVFRNLDGDDLLFDGALTDCLVALDQPGVTHGLGNTLDFPEEGAARFFRRATSIDKHHVYDQGFLEQWWRERKSPVNPARLNTLHATRLAYLHAGGYAPQNLGEEILLMLNLGRMGKIAISDRAQSMYRQWSGSVTNGGRNSPDDLNVRMLEILGVR